MTRALALALLLAATPVVAQEDAPPGDDIRRGTDLLSEGARLLLRGLLDEVEPKMQELAEALEGWDWEGLSIDDLSQYHAPEVLPNGDIILRRKEPLEPAVPGGPNLPMGDGPEVDI